MHGSNCWKAHLLSACEAAVRRIVRAAAAGRASATLLVAIGRLQPRDCATWVKRDLRNARSCHCGQLLYRTTPVSGMRSSFTLCHINLQQYRHLASASKLYSDLIPASVLLNRHALVRPGWQSVCEQNLLCAGVV